MTDFVLLSQRVVLLLRRYNVLISKVLRSPLMVGMQLPVAKKAYIVRTAAYLLSAHSYCWNDAAPISKDEGRHTTTTTAVYFIVMKCKARNPYTWYAACGTRHTTAEYRILHQRTHTSRMRSNFHSFCRRPWSESMPTHRQSVVHRARLEIEQNDLMLLAMAYNLICKKQMKTERKNKTK